MNKPNVVAKTARRGRPVGAKKKPIQNEVDWMDLAKKLQEALMKEMKDNEAALEKLHKYAGIEHHVDHLEEQAEKHKQMLIEQRGVIGYLEGRLKKLVEELDGKW